MGGRSLQEYVFPAHAGMARTTHSAACVSSWFSPHTRGWPDLLDRTRAELARFPRTRGDGPQLASDSFAWSYVFPAHAGMARMAIHLGMAAMTFSPHTRGWPGCGG